MIIANNTIRTLNGNYSITDLHKASGRKSKHRPNYFLKLKSTQDLIAELEAQSFRSPDDGIYKPVQVLKGVQADGTPQGTYVCKLLAYRYAMWISAKFTVIVLRAFDEMMTRQHRYKRLMHLHREYSYASYEASKAGYALSYYGRKVKPVIQDEITTLEAEMQPQLPFEQVSMSLPTTDSKECKDDS